jgi:hypothetical protein
VRIVAITTRLPDPLPTDHVLLPWHGDGKTRSGLRRKCAAVAGWITQIRVDDVREVVGILPPKAIAELLNRILDDIPPSLSAEGPSAESSAKPDDRCES